MVKGTYSVYSSDSLNETSINSEETLLEEVKKLIKNGAKAIEKAKGQNIILILGGTGSGKSTTINYLAGCDMKEEIDEETGTKFISCLNPVADIGDGAVSKTLYPNIVDFVIPVEGPSMKFCDTAGFSDNRGTAHDICASFSLGQAFEKSASILGVIVLIQESDILDSRLTQVLSLFKQLNLCLNKDNFSKSITFFISKNFTGKTSRQIYNIINKKFNQISTNPDNDYKDIEWLFNEFLEKECKNIHICNPLDKENRIELIKDIMDLEVIPDKASAFKYPISAESKVTVVTIIDSLEKELKIIFNDLIIGFMNDFNDKLNAFVRISDFVNKENQLDKIKNIIGADNKCSIKDVLDLLNSFELQDELLRMQSDSSNMITEIDTLGHLINSSNKTLLLEQSSIALMETYIQKFKTTISRKKCDIWFSSLEDLLMSFEVQSKVYNEDIRDKYLALAMKSKYTYQFQDLDKLHNLFSYDAKKEFEECINQLINSGDYGNECIANLISTCIKDPFTILTPASTSSDKRIVIRANVKNMAMSSVLKVLGPIIDNYSSNSIWFMAKDTIFMDKDLGAGYVGGKEVIIACKNLDISSNVKINVSGKDGDNKNSMLIEGACGENGDTAGNIQLYITGEIKNYNLTLVANGGNGAIGGNGKKGDTGDKGDDGDDAGFTTYFGGKIYKGYFEKGKPGITGDEGGIGSDAGCGGLGGLKGSFSLITDNNKEKLMEKICFTSIDGAKGADGIPGQGGDGGKGGKNGYNTLSFSPSGIQETRFFMGYFTDWSLNDDFFTYTLKLLGGSWKESRKDGPERTYAAYGKKGKSGKVKMNFLPVNQPKKMISEDIIRNDYSEYMNN